MNNIIIKVVVDKDGNVSSEITRIKEKNSINFVNYNSSYERYVKIVQSGTENKFIVYMANSVKYDFTLTKREWGTSNKIDGTVEFKIEKNISSSEKIEIFNGALDSNAQTFFTETEAKANSIYSYTITETSVPAGYYEWFKDAKIIVNLRTDENGKLMPVVNNNKLNGSYFDFDVNLDIVKMFILNQCTKLVIDENNHVNLYIYNIPINTYSVQLIKTDKNGNKIKTDPAKFNVNGNELFTEDGLLEITSGNKIEADATHTYEILEEIAPLGYTKLSGKLKLDITFTADAQLKSDGDGIKFTYIDSDGVETIAGSDGIINVGGLNVKMNLLSDGDDSITPIIQIEIPNDSKLFEFELLKTDLEGNFIKSDVLDNGSVDGARFKIDRIGINNVPDSTTNLPDGEEIFKGNLINSFLADGIINDIVPSYNNLVYVYQISENKTKTGYVNFLDGKFINLFITTDEDSKLLDVTYKIIDINKGGIDVTESFKAQNGELIVLEINNEKNKITINIKNTPGYKVRLNKTDTSGNPITTAVLKASINNEVNCFLNDTAKGISGESTKLSENTTIIKAGETQTWKIEELYVAKPYYNVLDGKYIEAIVKANDKLEMSVESYTIKDSITNEELLTTEMDKIKSYIKEIKFVKENGVNVLNITIKNPIKYKFKLVKYDADGSSPLSGAVLTVNEEEVIKDGSSSYEAEFVANIGDIMNFKIKETSSTSNHTNILENDKWLSVSVKVLADGRISIYSRGIYKYNAGKATQIFRFDEIYDYTKVSVDNKEGEDPVLNIGIINPIDFEFKLIKKDTAGNNLGNTKFIITSPIVKEQQGAYINYSSKIGVHKVFSSTGEIRGITKEDGIIAYQEKNVTIGGVYEYKITETQVPSSQYVNVFNQLFSVYVKVKLNENGELSLEKYDNGKNFEIRTTTNLEAPEEYSKYVKQVYIETSVDGKQSVNVEIENPIKYKIKINKKIVGNLGIVSEGTIFELESPISGKKNLTTDEDGNIIILEGPVSEGSYEYILDRKSVV